jgi:hypothetical protein
MTSFSPRRAFVEAVAVATALTVLVASKPTRDREVHTKAGLDLALAYRDLPHGARRGVVSQWLVPIYDFSQGIGQRIPNLVSQVTIHPLILVRRGLTVEQMFHLRLFAALTVALFAIGLTLSSWLETPPIWARGLSYAFIVPGVLVYTVHNDWYYQAEQLCGLASLSVVMLSRVWQLQDDDASATRVASLTLLTGTAGWILYLGGHPDWWPFAAWWIPVHSYFLWRYVARRVSAVVLGCCALPVALSGGVAVVEIVTQDWARARKFSTNAPSELSIATLWSADSLVSGVTGWLSVWLRMLLAPLPFANFVAGQRISWLSELGGGTPRSLNIPVPLLVIGTLITVAYGNDHRRSAARIYMAFTGSVLLGLLFHDSLGFISVLQAGITNQTADAIGPGLAVVTIVAAVTAHGRVRQLARFAVIVSAVGVFGVAVLYFGDLRKAKSPLWLVSRSEVASLRGLNLKSYERNLLLDARLGNARLGRWPLLEAATSVFHPGVVLRSGHPLVIQVNWARAQGGLVPRDRQRQFNGFFEPEPTNCIPLALDFLAVSRVVQLSDVVSAPCSADHLDLDAETDAKNVASRTIMDVSARGTTWIHSYEPSVFRSFWLEPGALGHLPGDCGVLIDAERCLGHGVTTSVISSAGTPLHLDDMGTLTYRWRRSSEAQRLLLLPLSYDTSLQVSVVGVHGSGGSLSRWNAGGLLAVEVPDNNLDGTVLVKIRPDPFMYTRSVLPWLNGLVFASLVFAAVGGRRRSLPDSRA